MDTDVGRVGASGAEVLVSVVKVSADMWYQRRSGIIANLVSQSTTCNCINARADLKKDLCLCLCGISSKVNSILAHFVTADKTREFSMGAQKRTGCPEKGAILEKEILLITITPFSPSSPIQFLQHSSGCSLIRFCLLKGKRPLKGFRPLSLTRCPFFNRNGRLILTALSRRPRKTGRRKGAKIFHDMMLVWHVPLLKSNESIDGFILFRAHNRRFSLVLGPK